MVSRANSSVHHPQRCPSRTLNQAIIAASKVMSAPSIDPPYEKLAWPCIEMLSFANIRQMKKLAANSNAPMVCQPLAMAQNLPRDLALGKLRKEFRGVGFFFGELWV